MRDNDIEPPSSGLLHGKIEHSASMIVEGRSSHDLVGEFVRLQALDFSKSDDEDMFGNTLLHQAFASDSPNLALIKEALQKSPSEASARNQLGRIPLHYALDRPKVDVECFLLLLKALLATDPSQDKKSYMKLRWGPISPLVTYLSDPSSYRRKGRFSPKSGMVAIDDGCAITDNCNTDHNSITVDSPCDISRTGDHPRKNQDTGAGASNVVGGVDVQEFEALDPSEGGSEDNDEFSQIHVANKSYDDGNASDESKAQSAECEQLDIIEDIVSSDVYDTYNNAHAVAVFANKL